MKGKAKTKKLTTRQPRPVVWWIGEMVVAARGNLSHWKVGDKIKIRRAPGGLYVIERLKWRGVLPALNIFVGAPRRFFKIKGLFQPVPEGERRGHRLHRAVEG